MRKVGRNDPCPCGSGKKYKHCHGSSNIIELNPERHNAQLEQLQQGLLDFAFGNYENELSNITDEYYQPEFLEDEELFDLYISGVTSWIILYRPLESGKTIFDIYYESQEGKIKSTKVRKVFSSWAEAPVTFYQILSLEKETLLIEDIRTKATYQLAINEDDDFIEGNLLAGMIVPYIEEQRVFLSVFELFGDDEELINKILKISDSEMKDYYPKILAEVIIEYMEDEEIEYGHYTYDEVAFLLERHMGRKKADQELIKVGKVIWKIFTDREYPIVRKPEAYAAALEYFIQGRFLATDRQTQKDLAKEYGVSPGTISKNSLQIADVVDAEYDASQLENEMYDDDQADDSYQPPMEQTMRGIQSLLEQQEFDSIEEANQFLNQSLNNPDFLLPSSTSPRDLAQDKLFKAQQARGDMRKKLINEALSIYPNSPDAYLMMAEDAKTIRQEYELIKKAIKAGEKDLGKAFFKENKGHFWMITETRPYMRAKAELGSFHAIYNDKSEAIAEFEDMLELNENDNQGIRYLLFPLYVEQKQFKKAKELLERYNDHEYGSSLFNYALVNYFADGLTNKTIKILKEADQQNPLVKDYLTGKKELPDQIFEHIQIGGESEAITYAQEHMHLWEKAKLLLNRLANL